MWIAYKVGGSWEVVDGLSDEKIDWVKCSPWKGDFAEMLWTSLHHIECPIIYCHLFAEGVLIYLKLYIMINRCCKNLQYIYENWWYQSPAFGTFYYLMGCLKGRYSVTVFKQN